MARIYLAAPWAHRYEAQETRTQLVAAGHSVPCRWLDIVDTSDEALEALHDIQDLRACEVLLVLNLAKSEGKACETGMALMLGMPVISVYPGANVFLKLPHVHQVNTLAEALAVLVSLAEIPRICPPH